MGEEMSDSESVTAISEDQLALLITTSIQTLKRKKKKCGREEVFNLVNESIECKISFEAFNEILNSLIENESVIINSFQNRECISLPKESIHDIETETETDDINEQFRQFQNDFLDQYEDFKCKFLHEVKSYKDTILNATPNTTANQDQIITILLNNIKFLKEQLNQKDKVIDSLITQILEQNSYLFQKKNTTDKLEAIMKQVRSNKEHLTSEEKENVKTAEIKNKSKGNDTEKKVLENTLQKNSSINENNDQNVLQEPTYIEPITEPNDLYNNNENDLHKNSENRENNNEQEDVSAHENRSPDKEATQSSSIKRGSHDKRSVVVLGNSMTKLLNGWEMAKKLEANSKVFVKTFSGATVSCMEDYMKPSLRNPPGHFILHVETNDLGSDKSPTEIGESIVNLVCQLKNEKHDVSVSTIIIRADDKKLNDKGIQVNLHLKELCKEKNIFLIDHAKKIKVQHLNKGKLHLTKHGSKVLSNNFTNHICKAFH